MLTLEDLYQLSKNNRPKKLKIHLQTLSDRKAKLQPYRIMKRMLVREYIIYMHLRSFGGAKSPLQKYDALEDKFASFYFNGYGVKKHLKKLRKVIELQPHKKGYRQYTEMLNRKLEQLQQEEAVLKHRVKPYQQSLKPASLNKLKKMQNFFQDPKYKQHHQPAPADSQKPALSNFPKITKSNQNIARHSQLPVESSSLEREKDVKSISIAQRLGRSMSKGKKLSVYKDRSLKTYHLNKSSLVKKPEMTIEEHLKQVKHDEFMTFLKKRQERLLGHSSRIRISEAIEQSIS